MSAGAAKNSSKVAAPWWSGRCASADRGRGDRSQSTGTSTSPPLPPQRDNVHLASLHTPPTPPTRRNSAETPADAPKFRAVRGVAAVRMTPLTRESRSPLIPDPSRKVGKQTRCFLRVRQRWRIRHETGRAVPRPHVNETTCVFRLFAIGVAQNQSAPVHVERERVIAERGCYGARRIERARLRPDRRCARRESADQLPIS